jgi:Tol biopolymer transport system component
MGLRYRPRIRHRSRCALPFILAAAVIAFAAAPASATFPGKNGRISYFAFVEKTKSAEIFTASRNGGNVQKLTDSKRDHASVISDWSPDGQRIAFDSDRVDIDGRKDVVQIYLMNADGSGVTQLTRGPGFHGTPGWSPDAANLAIEADWGGGRAQAGIWIIPASDPDGVTQDEARRLTTVPEGVEFDSEPQFSPDGASIVFTRFKDARTSAIHRVSIDGAGLERLTPWRLNASDPDWSPDGRKITFDSGDAGRPGSKGDIYIMRSDGDGRKRLTDRPRLRKGDRFVFSPSGTKIMYTHFLPERTVLKVMRPDGSRKHVVLAKPGFPNKVDWGTHP